MFFIVFIKQVEVYKVVPYSWIRGINVSVETFINYGVNSNVDFFTFWTENLNAFDQNGVPRATFPINNAASTTSTFPSEGWYKCRIIKFKSTYRFIKCH